MHVLLRNSQAGPGRNLSQPSTNTFSQLCILHILGHEDNLLDDFGNKSDLGKLCLAQLNKQRTFRCVYFSYDLSGLIIKSHVHSYIVWTERNIDKFSQANGVGNNFFSYCSLPLTQSDIFFKW